MDAQTKRRLELLLDRFDAASADTLAAANASVPSPTPPDFAVIGLDEATRFFAEEQRVEDLRMEATSQSVCCVLLVYPRDMMPAESGIPLRTSGGGAWRDNRLCGAAEIEIPVRELKAVLVVTKDPRGEEYWEVLSEDAGALIGALRGCDSPGIDFPWLDPLACHSHNWARWLAFLHVHGWRTPPSGRASVRPRLFVQGLDDPIGIDALSAPPSLAGVRTAVADYRRWRLAHGSAPRSPFLSLPFFDPDSTPAPPPKRKDPPVPHFERWCLVSELRNNVIEASSALLADVLGTDPAVVPKDLADQKQAAKEAGVSTRTLRWWLDLPDGPRRYRGSRVSLAEVLAFAATRPRARAESNKRKMRGR